MNSIQPSVMIDGQTVTLPGWAWVLAFALRGIPWAVEEALKPEFEQMVRNHFREEKMRIIFARINELKEHLNA